MKVNALVKMPSRPLVLTGLVLAALASSTHARPPELAAAYASSCEIEIDVPAGPLVGQIEFASREATSRFEITPAVLTDKKRQVLVRESAVTATVSDAVLETEQRVVEIVPERQVWVRDSLDGDLPLSLGELHDLMNAGVEIETVASGTCLHEHFDPPEVQMQTVRLKTADAYEQLVATEPSFRTEAVAVEFEPAYQRLIEVPSSFRKSERQVRVSYASRDQGLPVRYETVAVEELETPAMVTSVIVPARSRSVDVDRKLADGIVERTAVPEVYSDLELPRYDASGNFVWLSASDARRNTRRVRQGSTERRATGRVACNRLMPAQRHTYQRTVVSEPARVERELIPATYREIEIRELMADASSQEIPVPPVMERRRITGIVMPARTERHRVPCAEHMSRSTVQALQQALAREGFRPGPADGVMGRGTRRAIRQFQQSRGLTTRAGLTTETLALLGIR